MKNDTTELYTRVASRGLIAVFVLFGLVILLKLQGVRSFGPIPTLALPLFAFVVRAWILVHVAPEKIQERQRGLAIIVTIACLVATYFAAGALGV